MAVVDIEGDLRLEVETSGALTGGSGIAATLSVGVGLSGLLDVVHAPTALPAGIVPSPWYRVSETYPDPVDHRYGRPDAEVFAPTGVVEEVLGRPVVFVDGQDLTYWRGVPMLVQDWASSEPFGWETCVIAYSQGTVLTPDDTYPLEAGASLELALYDEADDFVSWLWRGFIAEISKDEQAITVTALGMLRQPQLAKHQPPFFPRLTDIGASVPDTFNSVVSRRYGTTQRIVTGIETAKRGSRNDTVLLYAQGLLGQSTLDDGSNSYTVMPTDAGIPVMRLKDRTTVHWTVTVGGRGVRVTLLSDLLEDPNVIYGSGQDENRERWSNSRWPGSESSQAPPYPNSSAANTMNQGESDASTDNGTGVTQLQTRLRERGYGIPVDGYYGSTTTSAVRQFQASAGIQVDGVVGPQTWNAMWPIKGALGDPFFMPIAWRTEVMPYLYAADGTITGPNPDYDPSIIRVEDYFNFGEGVSRVEGTRWAEGLLARNAASPNVYGEVFLTSDPQEGSRRLIQAGQNIRLRGYGGSGAGIVVHIARARVRDDGQTDLRVDVRARDLMELESIAKRRRDAVDPAHRILSEARQSSTEPDLSPWHSEPPAGIIPRTALYSGLWSVLAIPMGPYGKVVQTLMQTSPASPFAAAVFSQPVTSAFLLDVVGNPLAETASGWGAITDEHDRLEEAGFLIGWGQSSQAMGYEPGETSPTGASGTLTGEFDETASWEWASVDSAYVYLAIYSPSSTFVSGRFRLVLPYGE